MNLQDVIRILKVAERQGADQDEPEGARYISLSETIVKQMIAALLRETGHSCVSCGEPVPAWAVVCEVCKR